MPQYKLYYFDIRGRAEPIRFTFAQAGVPFEEVLIPGLEWQKCKEQMPFGQIPVLEVDGKQLSQSAAILRYLGSQHGLEADNAWDRAVGDELATSWVDMLGPIGGVVNESDPVAKKQKLDEFIEEFLKARLQFFNEHFSKSKSGFVVGNKVTWCDFAIYGSLAMVKDFYHVPFTGYDHLEKFMKKIESLPKIKQWKNDHPNQPFSFFPSILDIDKKKFKDEMKKLKV